MRYVNCYPFLIENHEKSLKKCKNTHILRVQNHILRKNTQIMMVFFSHM